MTSQLDDATLLARLVGIGSVSRDGVGQIAEFVCTYLERPGIELLRLPSEDPQRVNIVARAGVASDEREGLVLCGHLDTVPADEDGWTSDPFTVAEREERYYGRGSCDMKGFVAIAMNLFAALAGSARRSLALVLTCDEEVGSRGAQALARAWGDRTPLPAATVIGEPTSLRVVRMHKGHLTMRIVTQGRAAHSGSPHLGANAIEPAGEVVRSLAELGRAMSKESHPAGEHFPAVPYPVLSIARIEGGEALNVIPDRCVVELGIRLLPGQDSAEAIERVRAVAAMAAGEALLGLEILNDNPPMLLPDEAPLHRRLCGLLGQGESLGVSFASDGGILQRAMGQQCVLFGPGSIEQAHRADEFVPVAEMLECRAVLERLVRDLCIEVTEP